MDDVVYDADDDQFSLNFKLELPELSCEWAAVDVVDALGARRFNITGEQVYKHAMGASHYLGVEHAGGQTAESQRPPVYDDSTPLDHYGNARVAYEITASSFRRVLAAHKVLVVNFHAPWCSHCRRLAPVFEHAADVLRAKLRAKGRSRLAAALATADCSLEENADLCASQRIQAFPTIRVYKIGSALDHLPNGFDAIDLPDEDEGESESEHSSKHEHPKTSENAKNESSTDESPSANLRSRITVSFSSSRTTAAASPRTSRRTPRSTWRRRSPPRTRRITRTITTQAAARSTISTRRPCANKTLGSRSWGARRRARRRRRRRWAGGRERAGACWTVGCG